MGQSDSDLMTRVREGHEAALGELFERYHVALFRFCLRMTGNRAVSEDLVQDIFMRMLKHRKSFQANTSFTPWMYRIARNACIDHLRRSSKAPEPCEDLDAHLSTDIGPDESVSRQQQAGLIRKALLELPVERREVLLLSRYELKSYDEIARTLDTTVSNVKIRVHRAIKQLRQVYREMAQEASL